MFYLCLSTSSQVILQHQTYYICRVLHQTWKQCGWSLLWWSCSQRGGHLQGNQLWSWTKCSGFYSSEWQCLPWSQGGRDTQGSQNQLENKGLVAFFLCCYTHLIMLWDNMHNCWYQFQLLFYFCLSNLYDKQNNTPMTVIMRWCSAFFKELLEEEINSQLCSGGTADMLNIITAIITRNNADYSFTFYN